MVGFLDHANRSSTDTLATSIAPYLQLPGARMLPVAQQRLEKLTRARAKEPPLIELTPRLEDPSAKKKQGDHRTSMPVEEKIKLKEIDDMLNAAAKVSRVEAWAVWEWAGREGWGGVGMGEARG